ncbi:membrane fusion protein, cobalt-zinc-cadmium efflux system [Methylobacterium phyllostachyos]|uniref:Membrane fusion protein, cobalt-zinc-cadmium efflux system n=1 Tax=Methylobacterium phyllostachyos TaxID=582672 RepID=A0A1H0CJT8_9HYPH|nr:efflux RND transporter periplasmic adaptor subunit [Methylobacterium phyllostachyos]SDN58103.1 membrane fusion protein, cobalt-zinc-cadmium efflux system [Methylobacterium phyllostachyos]
MTLNTEAPARATDAEAVAPEDLHDAVTSPPAQIAQRRRGGIRALLLLALAGLAAAGWIERAPILSMLGLTPPAPSTPAAETDTSDAAPANPDRVTLDAAGQTRIGLAFGTAETRRIVLPVRVPGTVAFDERRVTHLKPRTQGRVLSLAVQPGDRVRAGETLATLDAAGLLDARNGYLAAQAALGEAKASEAVAALQFKRGQEQLKFGGVAQAEVERRQVDLAKAQAAVKSAEANTEMYRAQYQRLAPTEGGAPGTSAVVTPIAGVVTSVGVTLGEVVDTTRDAVTVADPTRILVLANLYGPDIGRVKAGDAATVESPIPGQAALDGHVRSVNAALDPATNTAPARIELDNPGDLLRANMFVSVTIAADLGRDGVIVPSAAIQQTEQGPIAFVRVTPDQFERRALTLGIQRSDWVEVRSGVAPGDSVATKGSFGLKAILLRSLLGSTD